METVDGESSNQQGVKMKLVVVVDSPEDEDKDDDKTNKRVDHNEFQLDNHNQKPSTITAVINDPCPPFDTTTCPKCGEEYRNMHALRRHYTSTHLPSKPFSCSKCGKSYGKKDGLRAHLVLSCVDDKADQERRDALRQKHREAQKLYKDKKKLLSGWNKNKGRFSKHLNRRNISTSIGPAVILRKLKAMETEPGKTGDRGRKVVTGGSDQKNNNDMCPSFDSKICPKCGKVFKHMSTLRTHYTSTHLQVKPYSCSKCGKSYTRQERLNEHLVLNCPSNEEADKEMREASLLKRREAHKRYREKKRLGNPSRRESMETISPKTMETGGGVSSGEVEMTVMVNLHDQKNNNESRQNQEDDNHSNIDDPCPPFDDTKTCPKCGKVFKHKYLLRRHYTSIHLQLRPFSCSKCGKGYVKKEGLKNHMLLSCGDDEEKREAFLQKRREAGRRRYKKRVEKAIPKTLEKKDRAQKSGGKCTNFPCTKCGKAYSRKQHLKRHLSTSTTCSDDKEKAEARRKNMQNARKRSLLSDKQKLETPSELSQPSSTNHKPESHADIDNGPNDEEVDADKCPNFKSSTCPKCQKQFADIYRLRVHYRAVHLQLRPYSCSKCGKKFKRPGNLHFHSYSSACGDDEEKREEVRKKQRENTRKYLARKKLEDPAAFAVSQKGSYPCDKCGKMFPWAKNWYNHKATVCGDDAEARDKVREKYRMYYRAKANKRFPCDKCDKTYSSRPNLTLHQNIVHGEMKLRKDGVPYKVKTPNKNMKKNKGAARTTPPRRKQQSRIFQNNIDYNEDQGEVPSDKETSTEDSEPETCDDDDEDNPADKTNDTDKPMRGQPSRNCRQQKVTYNVDEDTSDPDSEDDKISIETDDDHDDKKADKAIISPDDSMDIEYNVKIEPEMVEEYGKEDLNDENVFVGGPIGIIKTDF